MNSFEISASNVTYQERSFNTLQLLTESRQLSPIHDLKSSMTSDMKPQILFQSRNNHKVCQTKLIPLQEAVSETQCDHRSPKPYIHMLANQEIYQSFEIQSPFPSHKQQQEQQNLLDDCDSDAKDSLFDSSVSKNPRENGSSRMPIHMSVSRHLFISKDGTVLNNNFCLNRLQSQLKELQSNIEKLQNVIDKINDSEAENKDAVNFRKDKENRNPPAGSPCLENSIPRKPHARLKIDSIGAKSTQSEQVVMTPDRYEPMVTEFDPSGVSKFRIDDLSPISSAKKKERSLNVDESSSSILMKKKFSRRAENEYL